MEGVGCGDRCVRSHHPPRHHITRHAGRLIRVFRPSSGQTYSVIFSHTDPDVLLAVSIDETVRLSLTDGSVTGFSGYHLDSHSCRGDAMALSGDGTVLYVGYFWAKCVVALDVATLQLMWRTTPKDQVRSISYHDGLLFVVARDAPFTVLSAEDGSVVRRCGAVAGLAFGHSVFSGLHGE